MSMSQSESARPSSFVEGWLPCSREQEGLWLLEQTNDVGPANNMPVAVDLHGTPDLGALQEAFRALVERHPALRTVFDVRDGRLVRRECTLTELPDVALEHRAATDDVDAALMALASTPIDVLGRPPFRAALLTQDPQRHALAFVFHHCAFDGTSVDILLHDFEALYRARAGGEDIRLPGLTERYADYTASEDESVLRLAEEARGHWGATLPAVDTSLRLPVSGALSGRAETDEVIVEGDFVESLQALARSCDASLFTTLLAGVQLLQYRYAGGGDEGVATAIAMDARPRSMAAHIGMFANEAPLVTYVAEEQGFAALVERVQHDAQDLFRLRRFPFTEALQRHGRPGAGRDAAAQVGISYFRAGATPLSLPGLDARARGLLPTGGARRPVMVWVFHDRDRLRIRFERDAGALVPRTAGSIGRHLLTLLKAAVAEPTLPVAALPLLDERERRQVVVEWSATAPAGEPGTVHALVEAQAAQSPDAQALSFEGRSMTYRELDERANQLAHRLRALGVQPDTPVAICLERSPELVIGLLGILKAGGAYVPLDPDYPVERLRFMADDAGASVLVTQASLRDRVSTSRGQPLAIDTEAESLAAEARTPPAQAAGPGHLAYVIYTSGSTGVPKGVAMPHGPLCNLLTWQRGAFARSGAVTTLQFTSVSFDVAFQEIFSTLTTGGCLVLVSAELRRDFAGLAAFLERAGIERLFMPFLAVAELARHLDGAEGPSSPLEVITAGERLEITPAIRRVWTRHPAWTLENQYGPSESHVVTSHRLPGRAEDWPQLPPIGRPISGARIYVLDGRSQPVPVGVPGELHIGGAMLARGYLRRPKITAERFVEDPFGPAGSRMYRSGDVVRWRSDGALDFLGRSDHQVKVRGYRIEPGEVEVALSAHPQVREAAVVATEDRHAMKRLVAYLVATKGQKPVASDLRAFIATTLPDYMVPSAFVVLDALPLSPNGKLDRGALPAPELAAQLDTDHVAPRTPIETAVAAVWADVLSVERVGAHDNFFELGGHSLLAGEVIARLRSSLDRDLSLRMIFAGPTVAELALAAESAPPADDAANRIPRAVRRPLQDLRVEQ